MNIRKVFALMCYEYKMLINSRKMIVFLIMSVFIYQFIIIPLNSVVAQTGTQYSVFEIFIALSNCGLILMILPLAFIYLISDYPMKNPDSFLYIIRTGRYGWLVASMMFAALSTITFLILLCVICVILGLFNGNISLEWSKLIEEYTAIFPDEKGNYVSELLPGQLFNQMSLGKCFLLSFGLNFMYLFTFAMIYLLFELKNKKWMGLILSIALILIGTILTGIDVKYKWLTPTANSIVWIHYTEYYREYIMHIGYSFVYYSLLNITIIINAFLECKNYSFTGKGRYQEG